LQGGLLRHYIEQLSVTGADVESDNFRSRYQKTAPTTMTLSARNSGRANRGSNSFSNWRWKT
jgi:hypothetical protein